MPEDRDVQVLPETVDASDLGEGRGQRMQPVLRDVQARLQGHRSLFSHAVLCNIVVLHAIRFFCFREDPLRRATNKNELAETLKDDERWQDWKANHWARYQEVYSDGKVL